MAGIQRGPCRACHQLGGRPPAAIAPNVGRKPLHQRCQIARCDILIQRWMAASNGGEILRCVHRAKRVAWKVAKAAVGLMDVLQTTIAIVIACINAEVGSHFLSPQCGDVFGLNLTFNERALDFKA